jgi:outer membrane immunogenic protein
MLRLAVRLWPGSREVHDRMKKFALFALLLTIGTAAGRAQESRQDISASGSVTIEPFVTSSTAVQVDSKRGLGGLFSYRFMLTPRGALEANYGYTQNVIRYHATSYPNGININDRTQEVSAAYVFNFNFRKFNPFVEAGGGALLWGNIRNLATTNIDVKSQTTIVGVYGAGIAYELSPSFDIRAEYRGIVSKVPDFGLSNNSADSPNLQTNKYYNIYNPVVGIAYHF